MEFLCNVYYDVLDVLRLMQRGRHWVLVVRSFPLNPFQRYKISLTVTPGQRGVPV